MLFLSKYAMNKHFQKLFSKSYKEKVITQEFENSKTLQTENVQR